MTAIISFLVANSGVLQFLGVVLVGVLSALVAKNQQRVYTNLYSLITKAQALEISNEEKYDKVLDFGYNKLPKVLKLFVSEDNVKRAIIFSLTNLKKFSALKMGVTETLANAEIATKITEVQKLESEAKVVSEKVVEIKEEAKAEISKIAEDVKEVVLKIEKVTPKQIEVSGETVVEDLIEKDSPEQIVEDVEKEVPEVTEAVEATIADVKVIEKPIEELNTEIKVDIPEVAKEEAKVEDKVAEVVEPIVAEIVKEVATVENVVVDKVEEVKADVVEEVAPIEEEIKKVEAIPEVKVVETVIAPILASEIPVIEKVAEPIIEKVEEKIQTVDPVVDVALEIAKMKEIIAKLEKANAPIVK